MMVFKRRQIIVLSLVLMVVVAGYIQYSYKKGSISASSDTDNGKLGEAVYVDKEKDSKSVSNRNSSADTGDADEILSASEEGTQAQESDSNELTASKQANSFFVQAKMDKEITKGRSQESLKEIIKDPNATKQDKSKAYQEMIKMVGRSDKETKIETLVKETGFSDVVVIIGEDDNIDIIVKAPNLTSAQTAQITEAVLRQTKSDLSKIHIKNIF